MREKENINGGKSRAMRFSMRGERKPVRMRLEVEQLKEVGVLKYLGSFLSVDGSVEGELKQS